MQRSSIWQEEAQVRAWQRRSTTILFIAQALGGLAVGAGASMSSLVAYEVTQNEAMSGIVRISSAIGVALFAAPMAWFALHHGRRPALAGGWATALAGGGLTVLALVWRHLPLLVLGTVLFSAGSAANLQMRFAATDMEVPARRGRTISMVVWAATLGSVISPMLAGPAAVVARHLDLPDIAGVYVFAGTGLIATIAFILLALRPDPMRVAQAHGESPRTRRDTGSGRHVRARLWAIPLTRLAMVTAPLNQAVMTAVMVLTPVHMHHGGRSLETVGITLSLHIAGMYGLSPVAGWLCDRALGEVRCILVGVAIHLGALACCFLGNGHLATLNLGLFLLGLGWSFCSVAASSLVSSASPTDLRVQAQGSVDSLANVGAALAAGLAGPVMAGWQYEGLSLVAAVCLVPIAVLAARLTAGSGPRR